MVYTSLPFINDTIREASSSIHAKCHYNFAVGELMFVDLVDADNDISDISSLDSDFFKMMYLMTV